MNQVNLLWQWASKPVAMLFVYRPRTSAVDGKAIDRLTISSLIAPLIRKRWILMRTVGVIVGLFRVVLGLLHLLR